MKCSVKEEKETKNKCNKQKIVTNITDIIPTISEGFIYVKLVSLKW